MSEGLSIGAEAPDFELQDTDGHVHSLADATDAPATVVIWTCNHCPYAIAWHDRIAQTAKEYNDKGIRFYAINSNDAERYPKDSYAAMQERVKEGEWPLPYLHDSTQEVANQYGAKTTPDVFVFDSEMKLSYRGAPDSNYEDESQNAQWLRDALEGLLAGEEIAQAETEPVGCSIKWKQ